MSKLRIGWYSFTGKVILILLFLLAISYSLLSLFRTETLLKKSQGEHLITPPVSQSKSSNTNEDEPDFNSLFLSPDGSVYGKLSYYTKGVNNPYTGTVLAPSTLILSIVPSWSGDTEGQRVIDCTIPWYSADDGFWKQQVEPAHPYFSFVQSIDPSAGTYFWWKKNALSWSNDGLSLAFLAPETIYIYQFKVELNSSGTPSKYSFCDRDLVLIKTIEIPFPWLEGKQDPFARVFFSGDDSELYMQTDEFYRVSIESEELEMITLSNRDGESIYPLPNAKGVAYPTVRNENERGYNAIIVDDWNQKERIYLSNQDTDGIDNIVFSPNRQYVCIEQHASGSHWYSVFELETRRLVIKAGQYSYCDQWLNNEELLVVERPYFSQSTNRKILLNIRTGKRKMLSSREIEK